MELPQWEMSGETRQIGQYTCYKATMIKIDKEIDWGSIFSRRGRGSKKNDSTKAKQAKPPVKTQLVTAWYTPQIPVSAGPERYWGLPGLILEINAGRTTMLCTEIIINPEEVVEIKKPSKGKEVSRDEYDVMMKQKSEELRERFQNTRGRGKGRKF
jgi:GLPGLI family protein